MVRLQETTRGRLGHLSGPRRLLRPSITSIGCRRFVAAVLYGTWRIPKIPTGGTDNKHACREEQSLNGSVPRVRRGFLRTADPRLRLLSKCDLKWFKRCKCSRSASHRRIYGPAAREQRNDLDCGTRPESESPLTVPGLVIDYSRTRRYFPLWTGPRVCAFAAPGCDGKP